MSHGEWCEKTTESSTAHLFVIPAIIYRPSSPVTLPHCSPHWEKKTQQRESKVISVRQGRFINPMPVLRQRFFPNHWLIYVSLILFFTVITLISYHNAPGHAPCRGWWFFWCRVGAIRWSGRVRWNGEVLRKLSVTLAMCPRRQCRGCIALGSQLCWARCEPDLSWAHYLYQCAPTIGTVASRQCFRRQITHK